MFPDATQRRHVPHHRVLLHEDLLLDPQLASVELERLSYRQAHGPAGLHGLRLLGAHLFLLIDRRVRPRADNAQRGEGTVYCIIIIIILFL